MKIRKYIGLVVLVAAMLCSCEREPEVQLNVRECAPMPSPRACATAFVADGKGYVFAGRDSAGNYLNDLWRYSPETDSWEELGATPLSARTNATACIHEGKVYIGLGFNGRYSVTSSYMRDWWEYSPATQTWKRLADYPNANTDCATAFAGSGELYVGYGFSWKYTRDMFRYDIATNQWDSIDVGVSGMGYPSRSFGGTGCTSRGRHFMGTGYYRHSIDWWAELADGTHWEKRSPVPGKARTLAATAATDNYIYLAAGIHYGGVNTTGDVLRDVRRYDPLTDRWQYVAVLPQGLLNHVCFAIGKNVYIGLGETENWNVTDKLYRIEE